MGPIHRWFSFIKNFLRVLPGRVKLFEICPAGGTSRDVLPVGNELGSGVPPVGNGDVPPVGNEKSRERLSIRVLFGVIPSCCGERHGSRGTQVRVAPRGRHHERSRCSVPPGTVTAPFEITPMAKV